MSDLLMVVDELTLPNTHKLDQGERKPDGSIRYAFVREDPLLVQLQEAVSSSLRSGSGSGGAAWMRNVLDSDALHTAAIITATIGDWCRMAGATVTRDPVKDLRAWYVRRENTTDPETFYLTQLRKWAGQIRAMINPAKTIQITSPCPVCNQGSFTNDMGEVVNHPLQMTYRVDDERFWRGANVLCRACLNVWTGVEAMEELRDELDEKEAG